MASMLIDMTLIADPPGASRAVEQPADPIAGGKAGTDHATTAAWSVLALILLGCGVTVGLHLSNGATEETAWWLGNLVLALAVAPLGALVAARRPRLALGWLFLGSAVTQVLCACGREYLVRGLLGGTAPGWRIVGWLADPAYIVTVMALPAALMLFPDISPLSRRARPAVTLLLPLFVVVLLVGWATPDDMVIRGHRYAGLADGWLPSGFVSGLESVATYLIGVTLLAGLVTILLRSRRATGEERLQVKWVAWAGTIASIEVATEFIPGNAVAPYTGPATIMLFATALTVAVLRHRLLDIDLVIERTVAFAVLTAAVIGAYLVIVVGLGSLVGAPHDIGLPLIATAVVALGFSPLRQRVQQRIERALYGDRSNPYGLMTRLGRQLEVSGADADLSILLATVAESLKVPQVTLLDPDGHPVAAVGSVSRGVPLRQSVLYAGSPVGFLELAPRTPGNAFSRRDRDLIAGLAPHVGAAVHAVTLSGALQRSRRSLVTAKEEERRRLRRDLHDGLGSTLAALGLKIDVAGLLVETRPGECQELLAEVKGDLRGTLEDVRRLVYELRPPALDQLGLVGAVRERAAALDGAHPTSGVQFTVVGDDSAAAVLPAAVEVAAFRIATEAMTNVVRHAHARQCQVSVAVDGGWLSLRIGDDGRGLPSSWTRGVGTSSMTERAVELGGRCNISSGGPGTVVTAEIPVTAVDAVVVT
jgi:signal transduction histidine kinase